MGELITLSCPSCGGELEVNSNTSVLKCKYCGIEHLVRRDYGAVSLESYARCPKCGRNDRVEKVTSILRSEPEESGLATSLAPPERPSSLPKPQLLPKPEKTPKPTQKPQPKLNPKPGQTAHPKFKYKKNNFGLIIGGLVLFLISYVPFIILLGLSFDPTQDMPFLCPASFVIPIALSVYLIYKGSSWKEVSFDDIDSIKKYFEIRQKNPEKQKSKFTVLSTVFLVLAVVFIVLSLLLSLDEVGFLIILLGTSVLPLILGIYFLFRLRSIKKQDMVGFPSKEEFDSAFEKWKEENVRVQNNWAQENAKLMEQWRKENAEILKNWEAENAKLLEDWEKENKRRLQKWKEHNSQIPQQYRDVMERWEELYFCHRDDVVFIPGQGTYAPVEKMNEYLQR